MLQLIVPIILPILIISSTEGFNEYEQAILDYHNVYRLNHRVGPLELDEKINEAARACAEHNAKRSQLKHDCPQQRTEHYGENIYKYGGQQSDMEAMRDAVRLWYEEIKHYDFDTSKSTGDGVVGHFTQVVWKGSRKIGCGIAKSKHGTVVDCLYSPNGNIQGRFRENVLPPKSKKSRGPSSKATPRGGGVCHILVHFLLFLILVLWSR